MFSLALAACASSSGGSTSSTSASGSTASSAGQAAAKAFEDRFLANPTTIGITTPLSKAPPRGKFIVILAAPEGVGQAFDDGLAQAAQVLGWRTQVVDLGATPATEAAAFNDALALHPDAIMSSQVDKSIIQTGLEKAKAENIAVVSGGSGNTPSEYILNNVSGTAWDSQLNRLMAAAYASQGNANSHLLYVQIPIFQNNVLGQQAFENQVRTWCSSCKVSTLNVQLSDISTQIPGEVVSAIERDPTINWLAFPFGDVADGVVPALKAAGLNNIKIIGILPTQSDLNNVKAGTEYAWVEGVTVPEAWDVADTLARHWLGESVAPDINWMQPMELLTKANAAQALFVNGYYLGVSNYQAQFESLWHVK
jgi:ribose transport system substrate-binding protein